MAAFYLYICPVFTDIDKNVKTGYYRGMRIHYTNQGTLQNFRNFAETLDFSDPNKLVVTMDENWVNVNPAQLALTAALATKVGKKNSRIEGKIPKSARYIDRMGLMKFFGTHPQFGKYERREPSGRFVPISVIRNSEDQSRFVTDIIPLYHLDEKNSKILSYIIGELVRNALEHSDSENGAIVAAQYYKESNRISFAICDTGIGLWKSLQLWHPRTDKDAIKLALTPGISGTTLRMGGTSENAGAGLFFIKSIAKISRGYFVIMSGDSSYTLLKTRPDIKNKLNPDPFDDHYAFSDKISRFDGTLVAVDLKLYNTPEFRQLLNEIGDIYDVAVKEQRKKVVRKPNFM